MQLILSFKLLVESITYVFFIIVILIYSKEISAEAGQEVCSNNQFSSRYYLINISDISQISQYFNMLKIKIEKNNHSLGINKGPKKRHYQYFDYPGKQLLDNNQELFIVLNKSLPRYREDREIIFFYDNDLQSSAQLLFKVKYYKRKTDSLDKHELYSKVRRKDREYLKKLIYYDKENPLNLMPVIDVDTDEVVLLFTHYGVAKSNVTLEEFHITNYGLGNTFSVLKFELNEKKLTHLNKEEIKQIKTVLCTIHNNFKEQFPHIKESSRLGYRFYNEIAHKLLPTRTLFERYPLLYKIGQACLLIFFGFLVLYLLIGRYSKVSKYKSINKTGKNNVL